jgi:hypothetical protein
MVGLVFLELGGTRNPGRVHLTQNAPDPGNLGM